MQIHSSDTTQSQIFKIQLCRKSVKIVSAKGEFFCGLCFCVIMKAPCFILSWWCTFHDNQARTNKVFWNQNQIPAPPKRYGHAACRAEFGKGIFACLQTTPGRTVYCTCVYSASCKLYVLTNYIWGFKTYNWSKCEGLIHFPLNWLAKTTKTKW